MARTKKALNGEGIHLSNSHTLSGIVLHLGNSPTTRWLSFARSSHKDSLNEHTIVDIWQAEEEEEEKSTASNPIQWTPHSQNESSAVKSGRKWGTGFCRLGGRTTDDICWYMGTMELCSSARAREWNNEMAIGTILLFRCRNIDFHFGRNGFELGVGIRIRMRPVEVKELLLHHSYRDGWEFQSQVGEWLLFGFCLLLFCAWGGGNCVRGWGWEYVITVEYFCGSLNSFQGWYILPNEMEWTILLSLSPIILLPTHNHLRPQSNM